MNKVLFFATMAFLAACNNQPAATVDSSAKPAPDSTIAEIKSPYEIFYSSKFVMGDPKNAESVLKLWKQWDSGDLAGSKDIFADSVELYMADGSMMHGPKDSVIAGAQGFRSTMAKAVSTVYTITALKSTDKDENWAVIWGKEVDTDKKGKADSFALQETWRFNKQGKADLLYQFKSALAPPKK